MSEEAAVNRRGHFELVRSVVAPQDGHRSETANGEFQESDFLLVLTKWGVSEMRSFAG